MSTQVDLRPLVVIVDRNYNSALVFSKRLEAYGYRAEFCPNHDALIEYLKNPPRSPDLVVVDIHDFNEESWGLPKRIANETKYGTTVPIVAHTALADRQAVVKAIQSGYSDWIVRPIEPEVFRDRVDKLIKKTPELATETFQRPIDEGATVELPLQLELINEFGVTILTHLLLPADTMITIESATLKSLGLSPAKMRIVATQHMPPDSKFAYRSTLSFIGISGTDVRRLRHYAMAGVKKESA